MSRITPIQSPEPPVDLLPSHIAAVKNDTEKLSKLVKEGAPMVDPITKETPLHAAAKMGSMRALKWLLVNKNADVMAKSANGGYTAAHQAAVYGHFDCLKLLLSHDPEQGEKLASIGESGGLTVMSLATLQGDKGMVSWLLDNFPDTAHIPNSNGDQVVHFAAAEGHLEILKMFVEKFGTDIVSREDNRSTRPVFFAAQQGKIGVLSYLVNELEQDPVAKDKDGMTSIHAATQSEMVDTVKWLIHKVGPKYILERTIDGATPLHMAAASGNTEILLFYLENLEDVNDINVTDNINATPAHDAAEYGKLQAMLLLLKHGADITIKDTESKTPYQLALEQNHSEVAAMLADYRDNGPSALHMYEKKKLHTSKEDKKGPRTSRQEAEELSSVIQQATETFDNFREKQLRRQESLKKLNEGEQENDEDEHKKKNQAKTPQRTDEREDIEHSLGPKGGLYAVPNKLNHGRQRVRAGRSHQNSDVEDIVSETMSSHRSYNAAANRGHHVRGGSFDEDPPYATINYDTGSNYSRPFRVKRYQDTDSDISGLTGRSDYLYDGRSPGFYPPGYNPMYPPSLPPPRGRRNRATSEASHRSGSQHHHGQMLQGQMGISSPQYGFHQHPMYLGYPQVYPGYPQPGGMIAIPQHQAMMQAYGPRGTPLFMAHPIQMHGYREPQRPSRRRSLAKKKSSRKASPEVRPAPRKPQPDQDFGYGPAMDMTDSGDLLDSKYDESFHPPAPPIKDDGGQMEASSEVLKFDSNFLMAKPGVSDAIRHHAGTALNPAKAGQKPYDGRYDEYIMTDSEEEREIDDKHGVGFAAEVACILAIGCVAGLKGLSKMRKGKVLPMPDSTTADEPSISSAWDVSYIENEGGKKKKGKKSRRNSVSDVDVSLVQGLSPEEFAKREELERNVWDKAKKKQTKGDEEKKHNNPEEPQSELLMAELQKQSYQSVSKSLGEKLLYDTIGARHSSMLNIASSGLNSRMSLASSADEGNDDDDFDDAISMVHGIAPGSISKRKHLIPDPINIDVAGDTQELLTKEKRKKKKDKKAKKEKREKTKTEMKNSDENDGEVIENEGVRNEDDVLEQSERGKKKEEKKEAVEEESEKKVEEKAVLKDEKALKKEEKLERKKAKEREKKEAKEKEKEKEKEKREAKEKEKKEKEKEKEKEKREAKEREKEKKEKEKEKEKEKKEAKEKDSKEKEEELKKERKEKKGKSDKKEKNKQQKEDKKIKPETTSFLPIGNTIEIPPPDSVAPFPEQSNKIATKVKKGLFSGKLKEKDKPATKSSDIAPTRPAPSPPEKKNRKNISAMTSQTPAKPLSTSSQAKSASEDLALAEVEPVRAAAATSTTGQINEAAKQVMTVTADVEPHDTDEPREVVNNLFMFDTDSEEEGETGHKQESFPQDPSVAEIESNMKTVAVDLRNFLDEPTQSTFQQQYTRTTSSTKKDVPPAVGIISDSAKQETSVIFGSETRNGHGPGHIEHPLVGEIREKGNLELESDSSEHHGNATQFGFGNDISAMAEEMHNFYQEEDLYTYIDGSTPSLDQASYSGIPGEEDGLVLVTKQESEGQTKGADVQTAKSFEDGGDINQKSVHSIGIGDNVQMSEVGIQNSPQTLMRSISTQGSNGYSSSFEETVLAILRGLSDRMTEMKSNPTTTQKEIIEQEKVQHQMIQSMISMSLNDPAIMKSLQAMLKEQAMESTQPQVMKRRSSTAFEELQSKLLLAQEEQLRETKEHFQTQAEFQTAIQKRLEEQAQQQMKGIQSNFEIYSKKLEDQLAEHYRQWDEELRKRREEEKSSKKRKSREKRNKKHRKMKHNQTSESSSSDSDEGLVHMPLSKTNKPKTVNFHPAIKTMEAKIFTQRLLDDDEMETESQISIEKIKEKHEARGKLMRKNTSMQLDDTREAMRRYEARHPDHLHIHSEDEDDEDMMQFQHIRPVTLKRAEIKTQSGTGFTPARPEPTITGKVGRIQRIELGGTRETGQSRKYDRHKK